MIRNILFVILLVWCFFVKAQGDYLTRGWESGEIFAYSYWFYSINSDREYLATLYSDDYGETLSIVHYTYIYAPGAMYVKNIYSDLSPGFLYSYNVYLFLISDDYGHTWTQIPSPTGGSSNPSVSAGNDYGNFYIRALGQTNLLISTDYGQTFDTANNYALTLEVGTEPGEIYYFDWHEDNWSVDSISIFLSQDYGNTFIKTGTIPSDQAGRVVDGHWPYLKRGAEPGELYLFSWVYNNGYPLFRIYFSSDYGNVFEYRYTSDTCDFFWEQYHFSGGTESGEFYYSFEVQWYDGANTLLKIFSSIDSAKTFTEHTHILDSTFPLQIDERKYYMNQVENVKVFPNPFTTSTTLSFRLFKPENVQFTVYNLQSQIVYTIEERMDAGEQQVRWDAEGLPAGMYYYRLQAGERIVGGKMVLMK